jgi:hypothetical protein
MRNLVVTVDAARNLSPLLEPHATVVSIAFDFGRECVLALISTGIVKRFPIDIFSDIDLTEYDCTERDVEWFDVEYVDELGSAICIARSGSIARVDEGMSQQEGVIEGGIAAAHWSPDYHCLLIVTNNDSLLAMTPSWDVLQEV